MNVRKILIPIFEFGRAGGYRVLSELANHWVDGGYQVDFLVDQRMAEPYFPTRAGIRIFSSPEVHENSSWMQRLTLKLPMEHAITTVLGMYCGLCRIGGEYDVILANHSMTVFPVALSPTGSARKFYYIQAYEPEYYKYRKGLRSSIYRLLSILSYSLPVHQIANAPLYIGYKRVRASRWVPPGIDQRIFYRRTEPPTFEAGRPWIVGTIGRHEPFKGTKYVLDAFDLLAMGDSDVRLRVAFGNLPAGWKHERAEVVLPRGDEQLASFYRSIDVLVVAGTLQLGACHYPVLEAMACGTPVITTGYFPANSRNALIVSVGDSGSIMDALNELRRIPPSDLRQKLDRAADAIQPFYWENVAAQFMREFEAVNGDDS